MLPIAGSHSIVSAQSTDCTPSRTPDITTHVNVLLNGSAKNYHVATWGSRAAEDHLFPESGVMLRQPWIDATDFERRVAQLPQAERLALRQWTSTEDEGGRYSDNTKVISSGMNYELNAKLASGEPLSTEESNMVVNMDRALIDLPTLSGEFLRVAEHSRDCPPPWGSIIQVGDVVSNFPCFMSASTTADYAIETLENQGMVNPDGTNAIVIYKIVSSDSNGTGIPLLQGPLSDVNENEVLFSRNSCFSVEGFSVARPIDDAGDDLEIRVSVLLNQIFPQVNAKNLFSGKDVALP